MKQHLPSDYNTVFSEGSNTTRGVERNRRDGKTYGGVVGGSQVQENDIEKLALRRNSSANRNLVSEGVRSQGENRVGREKRRGVREGEKQNLLLEQGSRVETLSQIMSLSAWKSGTQGDCSLDGTDQNRKSSRRQGPVSSIGGGQRLPRGEREGAGTTGPSGWKVFYPRKLKIENATWKNNLTRGEPGFRGILLGQREARTKHRGTVHGQGYVGTQRPKRKAQRL